MEQYFKISFAAIATVLVDVIGGLDVALQVLLIMITVDYLTGLCKAFYLGVVSSREGAKGFVKKIVILGVVAMATQLDRLIVDNYHVIRTGIIYFYVANEGISVLENLALMGIPIPEFIKNKLIQIKSSELPKGE